MDMSDIWIVNPKWAAGEPSKIPVLYWREAMWDGWPYVDTVEPGYEMFVQRSDVLGLQADRKLWAVGNGWAMRVTPTHVAYLPMGRFGKAAAWTSFKAVEPVYRHDQTWNVADITTATLLNERERA